MATYTVYQPPLRRNETSADPERFVFVRDGFRFWAFLLAPLWLIWHRLWLVLIGYLAVTTPLQVAVRLATDSNEATLLVALLVAVLFGLEAASLHRWTLGRRRWTDVGIVIGDDRDNAERRFFDSWARREAMRSRLSPPPAAQLPTPVIRPSAGPDVIGLFPEPGVRR